MPRTAPTGRFTVVRVAVAVAVLSTVLALGCGGHGSKSTRSSSRPGTERSGTASADDLAFVQIARASGTLRTNAAGAALGRARRISNRAAIELEARLLGDVRAQDRTLATLAARTRTALNNALTAGPSAASQHAAAVAALKATEAINRELRRYAARHPELQALVPD